MNTLEREVDLPTHFARRFESTAAMAIRERGRFNFALTGGSSARRLYPALALARVDWSRVHWYFGDERAVPPDHPDSNHGQAEQLLLKPLGISADTVHRMKGELPLERAAADYEQVLAGVELDVIHLGVGPDGHICSLFPGHALLNEEVRWVTSLHDSPKPPPERITLTLPALRAARSLWFTVADSEKAELVRQVLRAPGCSLPAARAHRMARESVWLLTPEAARLL